MAVTTQTCSFYDVPCHASWLVKQLEAFGNWIYTMFMDAVASLASIIPVPNFLVNLQPITIPNEISFFLSPFQFEYGVGIIVSAYIARFIVRRIPVIG